METLYITLFLVLGILIGASNRLPKMIIQSIDILTVMGMLFLLFVMGISLGMNDHVLNNLKELGIASILFTVLTIFFSLLFVYLFAKLALKENRE